MPFVEGETLRKRLDREGRLPIDEAVRIAADVAAALQLAHERGVIHRGKAMVADFGIARVGGSADATRMTQMGVVIGAAGGYISPEQASGSGDVGHRADIYRGD